MIQSDKPDKIRKLDDGDLDMVIGGMGSGEEGTSAHCTECGNVFKIRLGRTWAPCPACGGRAVPNNKKEG